MPSCKVVITGLGILSPIGIGVGAVLDSLRKGKSGITACQEYIEKGMRSQVAGLVPKIDFKELIDRKMLRFMGRAAAFGAIAMQQAIASAALPPEMVSDPRTGLVMGSGGGDTAAIVEAADTLRSRGIRRVGPYAVPKAMSSTVSACLSTAFHIKGCSYSVTSACSTSVHCIEKACDEIMLGRHDVMFAGGAEMADWTIASLFDGMGALSSHFNSEPGKASRPYDASRDGFVMGEGGGVLVLESEMHAKARGARILAEIAGFGATSDGADMVAPSGEGAVRCMRQALASCDSPIDYINTHGTATMLGDAKELEAIREVFGDKAPPLSSTKSMTGHALGAAGVNEVIFSLLMIQNGFIAPSINIENLDPAAKGFDIVANEAREARVDTVLSNSFGFGGTNASIIVRKYRG
ncbi:MAG: beta-ketoacyl-ACP synthase II [Aeromonadales bacterium]|nr:beta-ketoacyl-ACP synthase II [Aeromonadales bacterium]MDY2890664.1 beta-ketoacyl-ACP synthase II [Succinivibrio sp.]